MIITRDTFDKHFNYCFKEYYKVLSAKVNVNISSTIYKIVHDTSKKDIFSSFCDYAVKRDLSTNEITINSIIQFIKAYVIAIAKSDDYLKRLFVLESRHLKKGIIVYLTNRVYECGENEVFTKMLEILYSIYGNQVKIEQALRTFDYNIKIVGMEVDIDEIKKKIKKYLESRTVMDKRFKRSKKRDYFNIVEFYNNYN